MRKVTLREKAISAKWNLRDYVDCNRDALLDAIAHCSGILAICAAMFWIAGF